MNLRDQIQDAALDALIQIQPLVRLTRVALSVQVALKEKVARDLRVPRRVRECARWSRLDFGRIDRKVTARYEVLFKKQVISNRDRSTRIQRIICLSRAGAE